MDYVGNMDEMDYIHRSAKEVAEDVAKEAVGISRQDNNTRQTIYEFSKHFQAKLTENMSLGEGQTIAWLVRVKSEPMRCKLTDKVHLV